MRDDGHACGSVACYQQQACHTIGLALRKCLKHMEALGALAMLT